MKSQLWFWIRLILFIVVPITLFALLLGFNFPYANHIFKDLFGIILLGFFVSTISLNLLSLLYASTRPRRVERKTLRKLMDSSMVLLSFLLTLLSTLGILYGPGVIQVLRPAREFPRLVIGRFSLSLFYQIPMVIFATLGGLQILISISIVARLYLRARKARINNLSD